MTGATVAHTIAKDIALGDKKTGYATGEKVKDTVGGCRLNFVRLDYAYSVGQATAVNGLVTANRPAGLLPA